MNKRNTAVEEREWCVKCLDASGRQSGFPIVVLRYWADAQNVEQEKDGRPYEPVGGWAVLNDGFGVRLLGLGVCPALFVHGAGLSTAAAFWEAKHGCCSG